MEGLAKPPIPLSRLAVVVVAVVAVAVPVLLVDLPEEVRSKGWAAAQMPPAIFTAGFKYDSTTCSARKICEKNFTIFF